MNFVIGQSYTDTDFDGQIVIYCGMHQFNKYVDEIDAPPVYIRIEDMDKINQCFVIETNADNEHYIKFILKNYELVKNIFPTLTKQRDDKVDEKGNDIKCISDENGLLLFTGQVYQNMGAVNCHLFMPKNDYDRYNYSLKNDINNITKAYEDSLCIPFYKTFTNYLVETTNARIQNKMKQLSFPLPTIDSVQLCECMANETLKEYHNFFYTRANYNNIIKNLIIEGKTQASVYDERTGKLKRDKYARTYYLIKAMYDSSLLIERYDSYCATRGIANANTFCVYKYMRQDGLFNISEIINKRTTERIFVVPTSTTYTCNWTTGWGVHGIMLKIEVPSDSAYFCINEQNEITLSPCLMQYGACFYNQEYDKIVVLCKCLPYSYDNALQILDTLKSDSQSAGLSPIYESKYLKYKKKYLKLKNIN